MTSGGGGPSAISAAKALEALTEQRPTENPVRETLDREELRQVEYEEMGLPIPRHAAPPHPVGLSRRIWAWLTRR
jgi:hypothetical protein